MAFLTSPQGRYWLLVLPAVALMLVFYIYPLLQVLWISVTEPKPGIDNYKELITSGFLHKIWWTTARICVITTLLTVLMGYVVAFAMAHVRARHMTVIMFCVLLTFWLSVLIRAFAWVMLLRTEGIINEALQWIGLTDQPLRLSRNEFGVIVGMVHFMLPLAILPVYANLRGIHASYVTAARGLGASAMQAFWRVYLPLSKPGIIAATILVFVFSLGFFITPAILGGGRVVMISEFIRVAFEETLLWGKATMLSASLLFCVLLILAAIGRVIDLRKVFGAT